MFGGKIHITIPFIECSALSLFGTPRRGYKYLVRCAGRKNFVCKIHSNRESTLITSNLKKVVRASVRTAHGEQRKELPLPFCQFANIDDEHGNFVPSLLQYQTCVNMKSSASGTIFIV